MSIQGLPEEEYFAQGHRACAGCGASIAMRILTKAAGKNTILAHATGCMEVISTPYPQTAWKLPWIHVNFENAAAVASGIEAALKKQNKEVNVIAIGGDGGTFDIGLQALSGAMERGHKFTYICYDNGAYMNTGVQRSGATPKYAATTTSPAGKLIHGKQEWKKDMPFIIAAHGPNVYVATANIGYPLDFYNKVKKALAHNGPSYIQVYTPCVPGWKTASDDTIDICKLAFKTKVTPLLEIENGIITLNQKPAQTIPVKDYLSKQGRFKHLTEQEIQEIQKNVEDKYDILLKLEESKLRIF
jgi:pyruvate ferredoxin oxidoreductase beta subunit